MSVEFVDTNIIVYSLDPAAQLKNVKARELMERLWHDQTGAISLQVLQEFYVTITRKVRMPSRLVALWRSSKTSADGHYTNPRPPTSLRLLVCQSVIKFRSGTR